MNFDKETIDFIENYGIITQFLKYNFLYVVLVSKHLKLVIRIEFKMTTPRLSKILRLKRGKKTK